MKKLLCLWLLSTCAFADYYVLGGISTSEGNWKTLGNNFGGGSGTWDHGYRQPGLSVGVGSLVTLSKEPMPSGLLAEFGYKHIGSAKKTVTGSQDVSIKTHIPYVAAGVSQMFKWYRLSCLFGMAHRSLSVSAANPLDITEKSITTPFMSIRVQKEVLKTNLAVQYALIPGDAKDLNAAVKGFQPTLHELSFLLVHSI